MKKLRTWVLLIIVNGIVMISGFSVLIIKTVNEIKNTSIAQSFENMRIFAVSVSNILSEYVDNRVVLKKNETINWIDTVDKVLKDIAQDNKKFRITLLDSKGGVVGDSDAVNLETLENQFDKEEVIKALNGEKSTAIRKSSLEDLILLYYATPLELDGENFVLRLSKVLILLNISSANSGITSPVLQRSILPIHAVISVLSGNRFIIFFNVDDRSRIPTNCLILTLTLANNNISGHLQVGLFLSKVKYVRTSPFNILSTLDFNKESPKGNQSF